LQRERTRHGAICWYVRVCKGKRVRLRAVYGTPEFMSEYRLALEGGSKTAISKAPGGSLRWLIETYMATPQWAATAGETRKQFGYQFKRMVESAGDMPVNEITRRHILEGRDRRAAAPSDANKFVKASRKLLAFALERQMINSNPAAEVGKLALPNADEGFHTWTDDECDAFEAYWAVGTRERLAFDILLFTGLRRSDAVRLGRQHIKDGVAAIRTDKTGETVTIPLLPPLLRSIAATPTGTLTFLVTTKGTPFGKESFGNWFRKACRAAGVPGAAHGLRKAGAVRAAENGATESQLNALFGWAEGSRESATYTRKAGRAKLAAVAARLLIRPHLQKGKGGKSGKL
jgi:integrase